jgi:hypothetical protein
MEDPRDVPLSRWMVRKYYNDVEFRDSLRYDLEALGGDYMAMAVYVRVRAGSSQVEDPFSSRNILFSDVLRSTINETWMQSGCVLPDYVDGKEYSYDGVNYNPMLYTPPKPWYIGMSEGLSPGEVNEGWLLCISPDVPISMANLSLVDNQNSIAVDAWKPVMNWSYSVGEQQYVPNILIRSASTDEIIYQDEAYVSILYASRAGEKMFLYYNVWYPGLEESDLPNLYIDSFMFSSPSNGATSGSSHGSPMALAGWFSIPLSYPVDKQQDIDVFFTDDKNFSISSVYLQRPWVISSETVVNEAGIKDLCGAVPCFDPSNYSTLMTRVMVPKEPLPLLCPGDTGEGIALNTPLSTPQEVVSKDLGVYNSEVRYHDEDNLYVPYDIKAYKNHFNRSSAFVYDSSNDTFLRTYPQRFVYDAGRLTLMSVTQPFASPQEDGYLLVIEHAKSKDLNSLYIFLDNDGPVWRLSCGN